MWSEHELRPEFRGMCGTAQAMAGWQADRRDLFETQIGGDSGVSDCTWRDRWEFECQGAVEVKKKSAEGKVVRKKAAGVAD